MKNFDSRAYSVSDFLEWSNNNQLELSPRFQRRSVWTDNARSYLMDTIVRGKPMPKVFIRQKINPSTKTSVREVVDGQQRLRTILSFVKDGFQINKRHNSDYGGLYFSQLSSVDEDVQTAILNYEISTDLLVNMSDPDVLDVFSRLNSYSVILNLQEKLNADHFGPFKTLSDRLAHQNLEFWTSAGILTSAQVMRMQDVSLTADLLIAMIEGIKGKAQIKAYYDRYEKEFPHSSEELERQFVTTLSDIVATFESPLSTTEFVRVPIFYSLFTAYFHLRYGIKGIEKAKLGSDGWNYSRLYLALDSVQQILLTEDKRSLPEAEAKFWSDSRLATTDSSVRLRRTEFILDRLLGV